MGKYDVDYNIQVDNLNNPLKRKPKISAFLKVLVKPLQWEHDLWFNDYVGGQAYPAYSNVTTYNYGDRITWEDRSNYEYINETSSSGNPPSDSDYWLKIQDVYLGLNERKKYSAIKIILERVLNTYFNTSPTTVPLIYIDNIPSSAKAFIVYPVAAKLTNNVFTRYGIQQEYVFPSTYTPAPFCFQVNVPIALANALTTEVPDSVPNISTNRENIVRSLVNKYNTASLKYSIVTY